MFIQIKKRWFTTNGRSHQKLKSIFFLGDRGELIHKRDAVVAYFKTTTNFLKKNTIMSQNFVDALKTFVQFVTVLELYIMKPIGLRESNVTSRRKYAARRRLSCRNAQRRRMEEAAESIQCSDHIEDNDKIQEQGCTLNEQTIRQCAVKCRRTIWVGAHDFATSHKKPELMLRVLADRIYSCIVQH